MMMRDHACAYVQINTHMYIIKKVNINRYNVAELRMKGASKRLPDLLDPLKLMQQALALFLPQRLWRPSLLSFHAPGGAVDANVT